MTTKKTTFKSEKANLDKDNLLALGQLVSEGHPAIKCLDEFCKLKHADIIRFLEGNLLNVGFPDRDIHVFLGEARAVSKDIKDLLSYARRAYDGFEEDTEGEEE